MPPSSWPLSRLEPAPPAASEDLTARELQVAAAIARGLGNKAIASELGIAPGDGGQARRQHHGQAGLQLPGPDRELGGEPRVLSPLVPGPRGYRAPWLLGPVVTEHGTGR